MDRLTRPKTTTRQAMGMGWDVLGKAANVAQMSGLHAAMLVAVLVSLLRVQRRNKRECAELERCSRRLRKLLQWPTGCGAALLSSEMGGPVVEALRVADRLVDNYHDSTLWRRLWSAGGTATQLRDTQDVLNCYCGILLSVNAHLLLQQQAAHAHHHPQSSDTSTTIHGPSQSRPSQAMSDSPTVTPVTGSRNGDTDDQAVCERSVVCISIVHQGS